MNKSHLHIAVGSILVFFLITLADLVPFWMPMTGEMITLLIVAVLMLVWVGFIMQEQAHDEREVLLKMHSGRVAYLSGLGVLTIGLVIQGFAHSIDPWVAGALAVMVAAKLFTRIYLE
jgi:peptidoglycan/LPS O-acetylase OafA/YrhL